MNPSSQPGNTSADISPDIDFVNFYQVLEAEPDATTTHLRRRINDLYAEAQANRDHRNVAKRRRYEALCELLPYCRIVLLDPDKRARYDRYLSQAQNGEALPDFENIMDEIAGAIGDGENENGEKIGLLGTEGDDDYLPVADTAIAGAERTRNFAEKSATASNATTVPPSAQDSVRLRPEKRRRVARGNDSLTGSVISVMVFSLVFIVVWILKHADKNFQLLHAAWPAAAIAAVVWIVTHFRRTPVK